MNLPLAYTPWALLTLPAALYVALAVAVARRQAWASEIKLAVGGTGVVLVSAWMISFASLMAFFQAAYIEVPLNALGPVAVDGEMAVGTIVWVAVGQGGVLLADVSSPRDAFRWLLSPRPYVALLVAGAAGLSAVANAAHPFTATNYWPAPWSYAASAVPGIVMFAVIHQLVILFRVLGADAKAPAKPEPEPPAPLSPPPGFAAPVPALPVSVAAELQAVAVAERDERGLTTLAKAAKEYRRLAKLSPDGRVTGSALGDALGISHVMGRNWKRKVEAGSETRRPFRIAGRREAPGATGQGVAA